MTVSFEEGDVVEMIETAENTTTFMVFGGHRGRICGPHPRLKDWWLVEFPGDMGTEHLPAGELRLVSAVDQLGDLARDA